MIAAEKMAMDQNRVLLLCVDVQTRLLAEGVDAVTKPALGNMAHLVRLAGLLEIPLLVTEQNPAKLGGTSPALSQHFSDAVRRFEKMDFSAWSVPEVRRAMEDSGRDQVVVFGMESHVCVFQTARDVIIAGKQVFVPQDAVLSRHAEMCGSGLHLIEQAGGVITTTETILFDLIKKAGTPAFKTVLSWIKPASVSPIGFGR